MKLVWLFFNPQEEVWEWFKRCFGPDVILQLNSKVRNSRFFEEATELIQACGMSRKDAHYMVDYIFDKQKGEPNQEVGKVTIALMALCIGRGIDWLEETRSAIKRANKDISKIRDREYQRSKVSENLRNAANR